MDTSAITAAVLLSLPTVATALMWTWYAVARVAATQAECDEYREACSQVTSHLLAAKIAAENAAENGDSSNSPRSKGAGFAAILADRAEAEDSDEEASDDEGDEGEDDCGCDCPNCRP